MSDEDQAQQQPQQPQQQPETQVIKRMVETPEKPPKGADSVYTIRKSEDLTQSRKLHGDG